MGISKFKIKGFYLTSNGNLLAEAVSMNPRANSVRGYFRQSGELLSEVWDYDEEIEMAEERKMPFCTLRSPIELFKDLTPTKEIPLWTVCYVQESQRDFSRFDRSTCNNGGNYGYWTEKTFFLNILTQEIASIEKMFTTSEFAYSDDGYYSREINCYSATNTVEDFYYRESAIADGYDCVNLENIPTFKIEGVLKNSESKKSIIKNNISLIIRGNEMRREEKRLLALRNANISNMRNRRR